MLSRALTIVLVCLIVALPDSKAFALALETRYATIVYEEESQLQRFNSELILGSGLSFLFRNPEVTAYGEVKNKVDSIVEKVEKILDMLPSPLKFRIVIVASAEEVQRIYASKYGNRPEYIAFYSPSEKTVYISARDAEMRVLAHEIAHVVIHQYLRVAPSSKIHEVLAQYTESHITD